MRFTIFIESDLPSPNLTYLTLKIRLADETYLKTPSK